MGDHRSFDLNFSFFISNISSKSRRSRQIVYKLKLLIVSGLCPLSTHNEISSAKIGTKTKPGIDGWPKHRCREIKCACSMTFNEFNFFFFFFDFCSTKIESYSPKIVNECETWKRKYAQNVKSRMSFHHLHQ